MAGLIRYERQKRRWGLARSFLWCLISAALLGGLGSLLTPHLTKISWKTLINSIDWRWSTDADYPPAAVPNEHSHPIEMGPPGISVARE
jgi:hypothetical protein